MPTKTHTKAEQRRSEIDRMHETLRMRDAASEELAGLIAALDAFRAKLAGLSTSPLVTSSTTQARELAAASSSLRRALAEAPS